MSHPQETIYTVALSRLDRFNLTTALQLYKAAGSATAVFDNRRNIRDVIPDCSERLIAKLADWDEAIERAEAELDYNAHYGIRTLCLNDDDYPQRLRECDDAPIVAYYKGTADLNQKRIISIVGTRKCTLYGQDMVRRFLSELKKQCPEVLVVSGLAYGIDIHAHRNALLNQYETVGVLAHGLDTIYPQSHRETAVEMISQGGLLTEFMTETNADKMNFVRRNRIVAGMSDACIVVESAVKGGALITADIARGYNRDVYAFPGRARDEYSQGCNRLIADNVAGLIGSAEDFVKAMGWAVDSQRKQAYEEGIERSLFPDLSAEEQRVVKVLQKTNDLQINILSINANIPIGKLTAILFELEMKGIVRTMAGGMYHLLD